MNNAENKTVLADVGGFTPAIDTIVDELGFMCAGVFGVIWRYCQMSDGKCTASQSRLAEKLGVNVRTIQRCAEKLVTADYLRVIVKKGVGVEYYDTGKAGLRIQISGYNNKISPSIITEAENSLRHNVGASYDFKSEQATTLSRTKKDIKIDIKDTSTAAVSETEKQNSDVAEVFKVYEQEIGMITSFVRDDLLDALEQYPKEWIIEAIKEAVSNNARSWNYVEVILKRWKAQGFKSDNRNKSKEKSKHDLSEWRDLRLQNKRS